MNTRVFNEQTAPARTSPELGEVNLTNSSEVIPKTVVQPLVSQTEDSPSTSTSHESNGATIGSGVNERTKKFSRRGLGLAVASVTGLAIAAGAGFKLFGNEAGRDNTDEKQRADNPNTSTPNSHPTQEVIEIVPIESLQLPKETPEQSKTRLRIIETPTPFDQIPVFRATKSLEALLALPTEELAKESLPNRALALSELEYRHLKGYQLDSPRYLVDDRIWYDRNPTALAGDWLLFNQKHWGDRMFGASKKTTDQLAVLGYIQPADKSGKLLQNVRETMEDYQHLAEVKTTIRPPEFIEQGKRQWKSYDDDSRPDVKLECRTIVSRSKDGSTQTQVEIRVPVVGPRENIPRVVYMTGRVVPGSALSTVESLSLLSS